jgi:hypothetical protein
MKNWTFEIDKITEHFVEDFSTLTIEQLSWKPNPQTWSIAQNIEHLIIVNETYYPVLASLKAGTYKIPFIGRFGFMVSFIGKTVLNAVKPDRKKRMKTFPIWEPTNSQVKGDILDKFKKHHGELKKQIKASEDLVEKGTVISSPVNKNIVYKLEIAFDIIVYHELRHLEQAKEVLQLIKNSTSC